MNHKYRVERGEIIRILYGEYPNFVKCKILEASLISQGYRVTCSSVKGHIVYLEDGGYVETQEIDAGFVVRLNKEGVDLFEGNNPEPEPGIEI